MKMLLSAMEFQVFYHQKEAEPFSKKLKTEFMKALQDLGKDST